MPSYHPAFSEPQNLRQFGSIVNRSPVVIGISTDGAAPILGQAIRRRVETLLPRALSEWAQLAARLRALVGALLEPGTRRRTFWEGFVDRSFAASVGPGHDAEAAMIADPATTTMFYMGGRTAGDIAARLIAEGLPAETPVLIAANISRPDERHWRGPLAELSEGMQEIGYDKPVLFGVGGVFGALVAEERSVASELDLSPVTTVIASKASAYFGMRSAAAH
ncbi:SAM-dependent methyltransferase [Martelella limonii]|uniref:precorrin-2 dehydrogenase/sirohydrochlorin ferrochelatase family protein n=1 Tax=Martelella limonii TaxID=1647649 RepID=UPI003CC7E7C7